MISPLIYSLYLVLGYGGSSYNKPQGLNLSFLARKILLPVILLLTIYVSLIFHEHFCNMLDVCMYVYTFFLANKLTETETSMRGKPRYNGHLELVPAFRYSY